jgi:hypothetical protein
MPTTIAFPRRAARRSELWGTLSASFQTADFAAAAALALTGLLIALGASVLFPLPNAMITVLAGSF